MTTPLIVAIARALAREDLAGYEQVDPGYTATVLLNAEEMAGYTAFAQAALTAITEAGYAVVPVEPTEAMEQAARDVPFIAMGNGEYLEPDRIDIYRAMIAATPIATEGSDE